MRQVAWYPLPGLLSCIRSLQLIGESGTISALIRVMAWRWLAPSHCPNQSGLHLCALPSDQCSDRTGLKVNDVASGLQFQHRPPGWHALLYFRADSRFAPNQWETSLQSNAVSHWLGINLEPALYLYFCVWLTFAACPHLHPKPAVAANALVPRPIQWAVTARLLALKSGARWIRTQEQPVYAKVTPTHQHANRGNQNPQRTHLMPIKYALHMGIAWKYSHLLNHNTIAILLFLN